MERTMRQLIGKIHKPKGLIEQVYLSEQVRCQVCQRTAPLGIEVVTDKNINGVKTRIMHGFYCRAHGAEYQSQASS
jgi:hypothetical protein